MKTDQLRGLLLKLLLGALIAAAGVAVIAVLIGQMNDVVWRAIGTIFSAIVHIGIVFTIVSITVSESAAQKRSTSFVINAAMFVAVLSFFTSIFGIWDVFQGDLAPKLYTTYAVGLFAIVHAKTLMDAEDQYKDARPYVIANYVFIVLVAAMLLGAVYVPTAWNILDGFYGRLVAALAIIDVTLSIVIAVLHRLYLQKHPELSVKATSANYGNPSAIGSGGRIIVAILLFVFVIMPLLSFLHSFTSGY